MATAGALSEKWSQSTIIYTSLLTELFIGTVALILPWNKDFVWEMWAVLVENLNFILRISMWLKIFIFWE